MSLSTRVGLLAGATALTLSGVSVADTGAAQSTESRIAALEAEIAQLKGDTWMNEQRATEVRGIVQDVLADADTRASLLAQGAGASYDKGFCIGSSEGNFSLKLNLLEQVRFVYRNIDELSGDTNRYGFENKRTRIFMSGHVGDPSWTYYVQYGGDQDGSFQLFDGTITKKMDNGWSVTAGQKKVPFMREELVSDAYGLTVERSLVNAELSQTRSQGIEFGYEADTYRAAIMVHDGSSNLNTPWNTYDNEFALSARSTFLFSGNWNQFKDFTSPRGSEQGMMLGVGAYYEKGEYGTVANTDEPETYGLTADFSIENDGWTAFIAGTWRSVNQDAGDVDTYGIVAQGGYYFTDETEGFLRYEYGDIDADGVDSNELSIITVGVNHYFNSNVKWTTDLGFSTGEVDSIWASETGTGWGEDAEDGQFVIRSQLQLTF